MMGTRPNIWMNLLRKRSLQDETGAGVDDLEAEGMRALAEAS